MTACTGSGDFQSNEEESRSQHMPKVEALFPSESSQIRPDSQTIVQFCTRLSSSVPEICTFSSCKLRLPCQQTDSQIAGAFCLKPVQRRKIRKANANSFPLPHRNLNRTLLFFFRQGKPLWFSGMKKGTFTRPDFRFWMVPSQAY